MADSSGFRLHKWGRELTWEPLEQRGAGPDEVVVRVDACGVGLTVLNWMAGDLTRDDRLLPVAPGHELIGRVVEASSGYEHLLDRRVMAYSYLFCGRCRFCIAGQEPLCRDLQGFVGLHMDGGYAPTVVLPGRNALPVDPRVPPVPATVIPDAVSTSVHVVRTRAQVQASDRVLVIGAGGGVGVHLTQVARLHGASVVGSDTDPDKLARLEAGGFRVVDGAILTPAEAHSLWNAGGPTVIVDLVGSDATLRWGLEALDAGGRMVLVTTFRGPTLSVDPRQLVIQEASVLASRAATRAEYLIAADLVARGAVEPVVGEVTAPRDVQVVHKLLSTGKLYGRGAIDWSRSAGADATPRRVPERE